MFGTIGKMLCADIKEQRLILPDSLNEMDELKKKSESIQLKVDDTNKTKKKKCC